MPKLSNIVISCCILVSEIKCQPSLKVQKSTACPNDGLELSCPGDHVIRVSDVHAAYRGIETTQNPECSFQQFNCVLSIPMEYENVKIECEDKEYCYFTPTTADIVQDVCRGPLQYVMVQYQCVHQQEDEYDIAQCTGDYFDVQLCYGGSAIRLTEAYYYTGTKDGNECDLGYVYQQIDAKSKFYSHLSEQCNDKQACTGVVTVNDTLSYLSFTYDIDAIRIYYTCKDDSTSVSVSKCAYDNFNINCSQEGHVIDIVNAFYGDFGRKSKCSNESNFELGCRENIVGDYWATIIEKCQSKRRCDNVVANTQRRSSRCSDGDWNIHTDFVTLVYRCVFEDHSSMSPSPQSSIEASDHRPKTTPSITNNIKSTGTLSVYTDSSNEMVWCTTGTSPETSTDNNDIGDSVLGQGTNTAVVVVVPVAIAGVALAVFAVLAYKKARTRKLGKSPGFVHTITQTDQGVELDVLYAEVQDSAIAESDDKRVVIPDTKAGSGLNENENMYYDIKEGGPDVPGSNDVVSNGTVWVDNAQYSTTQTSHSADIEN